MSRSINYATDPCAQEAKDLQNDRIANWILFDNYASVPCNTPNIRSPDMQYDNVYLRASIGYGVSDGCEIDQDSKLRNNRDGLTHDRCKIQLFQRIFQGAPNLKPVLDDPGKELAFIEGTDTSCMNGYVYKKQLMEKNLSYQTPLVDCLKDIQDPTHIVPTWTRGGDPTRDYVRRKEFTNLCGYGMKTLH
jgi:hypothetical protein